ncbi:MAG: RluA family pseudouridine synthase [Thiotrichales bacterium]|nr:MAG: RluA family pseudouridine synthase [Thiotrichales bacterium]
MSLEIIYQDRYLIAVNKPCGLLSVPGRGPDRQDCVVTRLQQAVDDIRVVHRLDCHTSGVMLLALGLDMQRKLSRLFHDRAIGKTYVALVEGEVNQSAGVIDIPMRGDPDDRPRQVIDYQHGKSAQTRWRLLRYENIGQTPQASRLQLQPLTGRTHQLRVHCRALGHPIVGDRLYNESAGDADRMLLHAERLEFTHPVSLRRLCLVSPCEF